MKLLKQFKYPFAIATIMILLLSISMIGRLQRTSPTITKTAQAVETAPNSITSATLVQTQPTLLQQATDKQLKPTATHSAKTKIALLADNDQDTEANDDEALEARLEKENTEARWAYEFQLVKDPATGKIPDGIRQKSIAAAHKASELQLPEAAADGSLSRTLPTIGITVRGPNNYGGRTRALAFDIRTTQTILAGGVSGGIFRSTDGGGTWVRVTPAGEIHTVTALAQDTRAGQQDTWYCGTGEHSSSANATGANYLGNGVLKSTDNGLTWTPLASTRGNLYAFDNDFDFISRIVVNPNNGDVLVAASELVKRSTDGGATWADVLGNTNTSTGRPTDLIYNAAGNAFYATINGGDALGGVYRSTDGVTWTQIRTPAQLSAGGVSRITLSNVGNTTNILAFYLMTTAITCTGNAANNSQAGLQLYDQTAGTWADHSQKIGDCASGTSTPKVINFQGDYNMCITTKPDNGDFIYLGGTEIYRLQLSTGDYQYIGGDQGAANATNLHVDNHLLAFEPGSNTKLWAGNDGGMRFTDVTGMITPGATGGYTWTDRNTNYVTYQYYRADINPTTGSNFVAGAAQDNAITLQPATAEAKEIHGGDGTCIGIISGTDLTTFNVLVATQNGSMSRIENNNSTNVKPNGFAQGFHTFFLLDGDNTNYVYYPTNNKKLLRSRNGVALATTAVGDASTGWEEITGIDGVLTGNISIMSASRNAAYNNATYTASNATRKLYVGTEDGKVYRIADPAFATLPVTPVAITPTGATGYVSDIAVNPIDDKEILVTYSNYGVPSVWYTADASVASPTWVNVEGPANSAVTLASARSAAIVRTGGVNLYIVGTSTGLYGTTTLSGATTVWERIGTNEISLSPCVSLRLRASDNKMSLGTHGNGLFMLSFPAAVLPLDLLSFTGMKQNKQVQLTWATANERNFSHYNLQKSLDGKNFTTINTLNATNAGKYQAIDAQAAIGLNYYRLEMIDLDSKRQFSNVISVSFEAAEKPLKVYPNPASDFIIVDNQSDFKNIEILNAVGQIVAQYTISTQGQTQIDVNTLSNGTYFVKMGSETVKFVKK